MTVYEWISEHVQDHTGWIRTFDRRTKMYRPIRECARLQVLKVRYHKGYGCYQINTVIEVQTERR